MKHQALFSLKDKSKKLKCCLLQFLFGAVRVKHGFYLFQNNLKNLDPRRIKIFGMVMQGKTHFLNEVGLS